MPVRATLAAAAVGIAAMAAALTVGGSLTHLLSTPRLYGVNYDADVEAQGNFADVRPLVAAARADPAVSAVEVASTGIPMFSRGVSFGATAGTPVQGTFDPTLVDGRSPGNPDEIVLGTRTASALHARIGDTIPVTVANLTRPIPMRVVGIGVMPPVTDTEQLGRGAVFSADAESAITAAAPKGFPFPPPGDLLIRFHNGAKATELPRLTALLGGPGTVSVYPARQPVDVANFAQSSHLPLFLAGLFALLATSATAHLLVSAVRRRRRDLAVLKTLGLVPRQVASVIGWQASTVAVVGTVVGLPVGIAAGRWVWTLIARQVGVVVQPTVPWLFVAAIVPCAAAVANLVAVGPAVAASRIRSAVALRAE